MHPLCCQRRVLSANKVTVTHKIRELEHGTLQFIDPEHLLEVCIQDIEELRIGQVKRGPRRTLVLTPYENPPTGNVCSAREYKGSEPILTRKEQSRDKRKGKKPTRERKFAS